MNGEYSKLQTDIINGAIPLDEATQNSLTRIMRIAEAAGDEDATGYEYRAILNVAKRINDIEIVRHMETLLQEKRAD